MARPTVLAHIVCGDPDFDHPDTCPDCGFESLLTFPLFALTVMGVGPFGTVRVCPRCSEDH